MSEQIIDLSKRLSTIRKWIRCPNGLVPSVNYEFNDDGSVNWRAMIPEDYLYPNPDRFPAGEKPSSIEGLEDRQLLIMLGGIKELAKLRGFKSVRYDIKHVSAKHVVAKCEIEWIPNYESPNGAVVEEVANATLDNCDDFCLKFLESIAANRAFVRCVRNSLNIHIVGSDELDKSDSSTKSKGVEESSSSSASANDVLQQAAKSKGLASFDDFMSRMRDRYSEAKKDDHKNIMTSIEELKGHTSFLSLSAKTARKLLPIVKGL